MTARAQTPAYSATLMITATWLIAFEIARREWPVWPSAAVIATAAALALFFALRTRGDPATLPVTPTLGSVAIMVVVGYFAQAYPLVNLTLLALIILAVAWGTVRRSKSGADSAPPNSAA